MFFYAECPRCGIRQEIAGKRNKQIRCDSCKATRQERITYGSEECLAWGGEFDKNDNPILDQHLYLPGYRLCGHRDCVRIDHIVRVVGGME